MLPSGSLSPLLRRLVEEKRILALDEPFSTRPGRPALYRIADSNGFAPGETGLVVATMSGLELDGAGAVDLAWGPDQLVGAWG